MALWVHTIFLLSKENPLNVFLWIRFCCLTSFPFWGGWWGTLLSRSLEALKHMSVCRISQGESKRGKDSTLGRIRAHILVSRAFPRDGALWNCKAKGQSHCGASQLEGSWAGECQPFPSTQELWLLYFLYPSPIPLDPTGGGNGTAQKWLNVNIPFCPSLKHGCCRDQWWMQFAALEVSCFVYHLYQV